jgi:ADP-heptose:LPS heptosyltransferase
VAKIESKKISVVMQGPLCPDTKACLLSVRKHLPGTSIILSTWKESDISGLDYDHLVINEDPGQETYLDGTKTNLGRQIYSTIQGVKSVNTEFCLKIRTDIMLRNAGFVKYFNKYKHYNQEYKFFKSRILVPSYPTVFNEKGCYSDPQNRIMLYHLSDWCYFGYTEDIYKLFDIPLPEKHPKLQTMCDNVIYQQFKLRPGARYCNQQQIFISSLTKAGRQINFRDWTDANKTSRQSSLMYIVNNFVIIDYMKEFNVINMKYNGLSVVPLFREWKRIYKEKCNHQVNSVLMRPKMTMNYLRQIISKVLSLFFRILDKLLDLVLLITSRFLHTQKTNTLLIVKPDSIGDYVLFRDFLPFIRQSLKYRDVMIVLLGNARYRALAEYLDNTYVDKFIWLDIDKYRKYRIFGLFYAILKFYLKSYKNKYCYIFYPLFSRSYPFDKLVHALQAEHKICCSYDNDNKGNQPDITDKVYTRIIQAEPKAGVFEFERNKEIIGKFLGQEIDLSYPVIQKLPEYTAQPLPPAYVAVCPEASDGAKQWPWKNFKQVIDFIVSNKKTLVVLLGSDPQPSLITHEWSGEVSPRDNSVDFSENQIIDLRGKTTLPEAACVLSKALCFIGNDSALLHIAAAAGIKKIIAICYGALYGRFMPYPKINGRDYRFIFPPEITKNEHHEDYLKQKYACVRCYEDISLIEPERVINAINTMI